MATVAAVAAYATAVSRLRRRGDRWPLRRVACLLAGSACAAAAVLPPVASHDDMFPVHIAQHLLLGMAGPALLALSAPVTLALRTLPGRAAAHAAARAAQRPGGGRCPPRRPRWRSTSAGSTPCT